MGWCINPLPQWVGVSTLSPNGLVYQPSPPMGWCINPLPQWVGVSTLSPNGLVYQPSPPMGWCINPLPQWVGVSTLSPNGLVYQPSPPMGWCINPLPQWVGVRFPPKFFFQTSPPLPPSFRRHVCHTTGMEELSILTDRLQKVNESLVRKTQVP